jgi:hypothetical protein
MEFTTRPYEVAFRFHKGGEVGAHYQEILVRDGEDLQPLDPVTIAGIRANPKVLASVQELLPKLLEAAEQCEKSTRAELEAATEQLEQAREELQSYAVRVQQLELELSRALAPEEVKDVR